jgi:non-heme chloroperoxidase
MKDQQAPARAALDRPPRWRGGYRIVSTDGVELAYRDWGSGPPIVFVHGFAMGAATWDHQLHFFASKGMRCIAYDKRGHGGSDKPWDDYGYDRLADDLAAVIDQLDLQDAILVGHSMGAAEIVNYLLRHGSSRVAKIVLASAALPCVLRAEDNPDGLDPAIIDYYSQLILRDAPHTYATVLGPAFFGEQESPEMVSWGVNTALQTCLSAAMACMQTYSRADFRSVLKDIDVPTLVLHGLEDRSQPVEQTGQRTAAAIPGSRLIVYEGGPHAIYLTHRDRFNSDILDFIQ